MSVILIAGVLLVTANAISASAPYEVAYAINAGGEEHTDSDNIHYQRDPLMGKIGTASDFGKQYSIGRVPQWDEYLYQTERYHNDNFGYDIPVTQDSDYALVLKFSEVYFTSPNQKVFDVMLNNEHIVVNQLDIYDQVGKITAHDEIIYFTVSRGRLYYKEEESEVRNGRIRIEFIKGTKDNPKINAIALFRGDLHAIPKLPSLKKDSAPQPAQPAAIEPEPKVERRKASKPRKTSGPRQQDPYTLDDSTVMLPVFVVIGAFIPVLFCLCKL